MENTAVPLGFLYLLFLMIGIAIPALVIVLLFRLVSSATQIIALLTRLVDQTRPK